MRAHARISSATDLHVDIVENLPRAMRPPWRLLQVRGPVRYILSRLWRAIEPPEQ